MIGFVYVIGAQDNPVKIGHANRVETRLTSLQMGNPDELRILAKVVVPWDLAALIEKQTHGVLSHHHRRGEWYNVSAATAVQAIEGAKAAVAVSNDNDRYTATYLDDIFKTYTLHPWARHALNHYHVRLNTNGGHVDVKKMNALIQAQAGTAALLAFQTFRERKSFLFDLQRKDPATFRAACEAVVKAINALSIWYAEQRQARLLDKISGNAA